jgi:type II secretory pathway pseudopilin PulG
MGNRIRGDESGFTLIELMVSALLTVVVLVIVTGIFVSMNATAGSVRTVTAATTAGQAASSQVQRAARNSSTMGVTSLAAGDQLLTARTLGSGSTAVWTCSYWYYSATNKTIRYKTASSAIPSPTAASQASWSLLSDGVSLVGSTAVFTVPQTSPPETLMLSFQESAGTSAPVTFTSSTTNHQTFDYPYGGPSSC